MRQRYNEPWPAALPWALESATLVLGIGGQLHDAFSTTSRHSWLNLHAAFGLALCMAVVANFHSVRHLTPASDSGMGLFARHLSRRVYVLLYALVGAKQIIDLSFTVYVDHGLKLGWISTGAGVHPHRPVLVPEEFQVYLAYGLLALILIRVLAAFWQYRDTHHSSQVEYAPTAPIPGAK